jgi:hypothetical protein
MTVEGVPYRRFSHGWGWDPYCATGRGGAHGPAPDAEGDATINVR